VNKETIEKTVAALADALQTRDYERFTSFFSPSAVMEIPFAAHGATLLQGLPAIKAHFEGVRKSPLGTLLEIEKVTARPVFGNDGFVTIEYFMKATAVRTKEAFEIPSSIALVQFADDHIVLYKDFPNTIGIAKKAGVLAQLAASLTPPPA
jgi:hypothetical protein